MTSPIPSTNSRLPNVFRVTGSISTPSGCAKVPTIFLANEVLTPVFPPMEESTCAVKLVGI